MNLVAKFKSSNLNLTAWCKENGICKGSIYPYVKRSKENPQTPSIKEWGAIEIAQKSSTPITIKVSDISIEVSDSFNKQALSDILEVVLNHARKFT